MRCHTSIELMRETALYNRRMSVDDGADSEIRAGLRRVLIASRTAEGSSGDGQRWQASSTASMLKDVCPRDRPPFSLPLGHQQQAQATP